MFAAGAAVPGQASAVALMAGPVVVCVAFVATLRARHLARRRPGARDAATRSPLEDLRRLLHAHLPELTPARPAHRGYRSWPQWPPLRATVPSMRAPQAPRPRPVSRRSPSWRALPSSCASWALAARGNIGICDANTHACLKRWNAGHRQELSTSPLHRYRDLPAPLREVGAMLEARAIHTGRSAYHHLLAMAQSNRIGGPAQRPQSTDALTGSSAGALTARRALTASPRRCGRLTLTYSAA